LLVTQIFLFCWIFNLVWKLFDHTNSHNHTNISLQIFPLLLSHVIVKRNFLFCWSHKSFLFVGSLISCGNSLITQIFLCNSFLCCCHTLSLKGIFFFCWSHKSFLSCYIFNLTWKLFNHTNSHKYFLCCHHTSSLKEFPFLLVMKIMQIFPYLLDSQGAYKSTSVP
jgi:hypothetical protein